MLAANLPPYSVPAMAGRPGRSLRDSGRCRSQASGPSTRRHGIPAQKAGSEFGSLDVLVNNVLFPLPQYSFEEIPYEVWQRKIEVEVTGSFLLCKEVLPVMIQQKWGRIILFTGMAAYDGSDPLRGTTELGLTGLARGIAREYGEHNITANCVGPGSIIDEEDGAGRRPIREESSPLPRWGKPEEASKYR